MRKVLVLLSVLGIVAVGAPVLRAAPAAAAGLPPAVVDCDQNARLTHHYSISQLRYALNHIPAEISEYGNCHDLIQHQLLVQLGELHVGGGGSGGGDGSFLPTWLIVVIAALLVAAGGVGLQALRQRRSG